MNHRYLAKKHMPFVYQLYKGPYDNIQPVYFGEYLPNQPVTVYYEVLEFDEIILIAYCLFHRYDWKTIGPHQFDFEGFIKVVDRQTRLVRWGCTRFHYRLKFMGSDFNAVTIEAKGHGIKPGYHPKKNEKILRFGPEDFSYRTMAGTRFKEVTYPIFNRFGVTEWRIWNDTRIEREFGFRRTEGLIYKNPEKLFSLAKKCSLV